MIRACIFAICLAAPAAAQDPFAASAISACVGADSLETLEASLLDEGWDAVGLDTNRADELRGITNQGMHAATRFTRPFAGLGEVREFTSAAAASAMRIEAFSGMYERDGLALSIMPGRSYSDPDVTCTYAGARFPEAEGLLAEGAIADDRVAMVFRSEQRNRGGQDEDAITIIRLDAGLMALPFLTGRYSIIVTRYFPEP